MLRLKTDKLIMHITSRKIYRECQTLLGMSDEEMDEFLHSILKREMEDNGITIMECNEPSEKFEKFLRYLRDNGAADWKAAIVDGKCVIAPPEGNASRNIPLR